MKILAIRNEHNEWWNFGNGVWSIGMYGECVRFCHNDYLSIHVTNIAKEIKGQVVEFELKEVKDT